MGWLWGSSEEKKEDPYGKLSPELRDFLDKESQSQSKQPSSRTPAASSAPSASVSRDGAPDTYRSQLGIAPTEQASAAAPAQSDGVPKESLFQDGRYAHLWKNYKPIAEVESMNRSDQDRLTDVIETFNERRAQVGRAAIENCVFEQMAEQDCFKRGGLHAKMTMCRDENRAFNRCYIMQSRFLKALGYLSMNRTAEEEERIQMHSDKLYQEMLAREKAAEEAKKEGKPEPRFEPLLSDVSPITGVVGATSLTSLAEGKKLSGLDIYSPDRRKEIEKKLIGKTPAERDLEIQLMVAESNASVEYAEKIRDYYDDEKKIRAERRERGKESFGDTVKRLWGWDR